MISGLVLKYLNGECFVIRRGYETALLRLNLVLSDSADRYDALARTSAPQDAGFLQFLSFKFSLLVRLEYSRPSRIPGISRFHVSLSAKTFFATRKHSSACGTPQ